MVRKPERPDGLRRVGNQPEPKLIALSVSENAARCSQRRVLDVRRGRRLGRQRSRVVLDRRVDDPHVLGALRDPGAGRADLVEQRAQPRPSIASAP